MSGFPALCDDYFPDEGHAEKVVQFASLFSHFFFSAGQNMAKRVLLLPILLELLHLIMFSSCRAYANPQLYSSQRRHLMSVAGHAHEIDEHGPHDHHEHLEKEDWLQSRQHLPWMQIHKRYKSMINTAKHEVS